MSSSTEERLQQRPPQSQSVKPGRQSELTPQPLIDDPEYKPAGKLLDQVAVITGGDSGIGQAVAVIFAKEGADVVISYYNEHEDAKQTEALVQKYGRKCILMPGDLKDKAFCESIADKTQAQFGKIDILVNNAAEHWESESLKELDLTQMELVFQNNVFPYFYLTKAVLKYMQKGGRIINTASVTAYKGSGHLLDYASTKGAIVTFTRSLSEQLISKGIRVNGVAPGPIWTPLIASSFSPKDVQEFGADVPMGRAGQPSEVAACYAFLAAKDSSYISGQFLHPNGGKVVNG